MATRIEVDGSRRTVHPRDGRSFTLAEIYEHVGCETVELLHLADGNLLWMDEEAKLQTPRKAANLDATALLHDAGGVAWDFVLGPVLVTTPIEGGEEP